MEKFQKKSLMGLFWIFNLSKYVFLTTMKVFFKSQQVGRLFIVLTSLPLPGVQPHAATSFTYF